MTSRLNTQGKRCATEADLARRLVDVLGGRFSTEMGIDVDKGDEEVERWVLAATLFGTRISAAVAVRTYREMSESGIKTAADVEGRGWQELVEVLDRGGYVRYDFRTATRLQKVAAAVRSQGVQALHGASLGETRAKLDALPGWGPVTVSLFLRELRGVWPEVDPPPEGRTLEAAEHVGLDVGQRDPREELVRIAAAGGVDVRDLEASLIRLWLTHHRSFAGCSGGPGCRALSGDPR